MRVCDLCRDDDAKSYVARLRPIMSDHPSDSEVRQAIDLPGLYLGIDLCPRCSKIVINHIKEILSPGAKP